MRGIQKTQGVNRGAACIGQTRIAVWMLEEARREGLSDEDILAMYPHLTKSDLNAAWRYSLQNREEIEQQMRNTSIG